MHIHFVGIGGISMSGLASIALNNNNTVSGSDRESNSAIEKLREQGAVISIGHSYDNVPINTNLIVYTAAVPESNPELIYAKENNVNLMDRAEFLGKLMKDHKVSFAVSGTHGKTSTSSMLSTILLESKKDPTISIGGNLSNIGGNYRIGQSEYFVTEACEYVDSFLTLKPKYSIILNIEHEHLDYFKDINQLLKSFNSFAKQTDINGKVIANGDDYNVRKATKDIANVVYFGFNNNNDYVIKNIQSKKFGSTFDIQSKNNLYSNFNINVIGDFNIMNASSAIIALLEAGLNETEIKEGINKYNGVGRRFEKKGEFLGATVYDDYAHHPTEVKATINSASNLDKNRLITIFQPHTFSRTFELMDDFENSFDKTDILILTDIYPSREIDTGYVHSKDLYNRLIKKGINVSYIPDFDSIVEYLKNNTQKNDIIITMGAGNINSIANSIC